MKAKPMSMLVVLAILVPALMLTVAVLPGARAATIVQECGQGSQPYVTATASPMSLAGVATCAPPSGPYQNYFVQVVGIARLNGTKPATTSVSVTLNPMLAGKPTVSLTKYGTYASPGNAVVIDIWYITYTADVYPYILSPGGMSNAFVNATWTGGGTMRGSIIWTEFYGVDQTTPIRAVASSSANGTTASTAVTSAAGDMVVDTIEHVGSSTVNPDGSQTWTINDGVAAARASYKDSAAGTTTMAWSLNPKMTYLHVAVDVQQVTGHDPTTGVRAGTCFGTGQQFLEGTFNGTAILGNSVQIAGTGTSGSWTSPTISPASGAFVADINFTYGSSTSARFISSIAVVDASSGALLYNNSLFFWGGSQFNQNVGHLQVTSYQIRVWFAGDGVVSPTLNYICVQTVGPAGQLQQDWLIYFIIIGAILVIAVAAWVVIHFV